MQIVINHLTRMGVGRICVAGVDPSTEKHVRPILPDGLSSNLLERNKGPFDIGNIVDLGKTTACPTKPKVEDHEFVEKQASKVRVAKSDGFWKLLTALSDDDWTEIFGNKLVLSRNEDKAYLPAGTGKASLGCLIPIGKPEIYVNYFDKLRIRVNANFGGQARQFDLSLTDIRFYEDNHTTPDGSVVAAINKQLKSEEVVLGVGVGYKMNATEYYPEGHWLQVNAVHLSGKPVWQLG